MYKGSIMITIKSAREIEIMKESCKLAAKTLHFLGKNLKVGMSTEDINKMCHQYTINRNAIPATLGYHGFPASLCTSRNEVICHGIPSAKEFLKDGDIINLDVTTIWKGFHGDTNRTFFVGKVKPEIKKLVEVTYECMMAGIAVCKAGVRIGDIGAVIEEMAGDNGFSVVHEYCGHGIGRVFHEEPQITHFGKRGTGVEMRPGMTFTIEPMINLGKRQLSFDKDGWTTRSIDRKVSAHFEHSIAIRRGKADILSSFEYIEQVLGNKAL